MSTFIVREEYASGKTKNRTIEANDSASALSIADSLFGGRHMVLQQSADITTLDALETPVSYKGMTVVFKNTSTKETGFINLLVDYSKSTTDVIAAFEGKTIDGVTVDEATISKVYEVVV